MAQKGQRYLVVFYVALTALTSCGYSASQRFLGKANDYGFNEIVIPTENFALKAYTNTAFENERGGILHIYLAGDGVPFFRDQYINPDPTPKRALTLDLMALDQAPSILIGRPCYHYESRQDNQNTLCNDHRWWTTHRYSEDVVNALNEAIRTYTSNNKEIVIIGFSGGGTLAALLAQKLQNVRVVVGISPNLDIGAWTDFHDYTPLYGSLNPRDSIEKWPTGTRGILLSGQQDKNVPANLWRAHYEGVEHVEIINYANFTHTCCWSEIWPEFLSELSD